MGLFAKSIFLSRNSNNPKNAAKRTRHYAKMVNQPFFADENPQARLKTGLFYAQIYKKGLFDA